MKIINALRTPGPRRLLAMLGTLVVLLLGILLGLDVRYEYTRNLTELEETLEAQTKLLAEHAQLSLAATDMVLAEVQEDIGNRGLDALAADRAYWQSLNKMLARLPQLNSLIVADAHGRVRLSSVVSPPPELDVSDRDYFDAHALGWYHHIGEPIFSRASERWLIPVSIRLGDPSGEFQGLIMASLDIAYFQNFYSSVRDDMDLRLGMFRRDGTLLSLDPALSFSASTDSRPAVAEVFADHRTRTWLNGSPVDGIKKFTSFRRLDGYPVIVTAAYDYQAFLTGLYPVLLRNAALFVTFTAVIVLSVVLIGRSMRAAEHAREAELQSARLCRAIAQNLPKGRVIVFGHDLRIVFADGQIYRDHPVVNSTQIQGKTIWEAFSPEICAESEPLMRSTLAGREEEAEIVFEERMFRVTTAPIKDARGRIINGLALLHDITKLKQTQRALETLSTTDSLLEIANRREFDRVLEHEWRRGRRKRQPMSLLMVDVDCFKQYNDAYGHLEGDACLQQVAAVLGEAVNRPGDLLARYGGEEMAVLLPNTELDGALHIAQRIHALLAERALSFDASLVAGHVTVSIGVASIVPSPQDEPSSLIKKADEALYAAKANGRNMTESDKALEGNAGQTRHRETPGPA